MLSRKKLDEKMTKWTKAVIVAAALVRKLMRTLSEETEAQTTKRLSLWEAAKAELKKTQAHEADEVGPVYDLFCKTLKGDPELQWDRIGDDMHAKDPWEDLRGAKHNGLRMKSVASLWDCIDFHKLTVYSVDAAERQRFYMLCNLKKPAKSIIRAHVTRIAVASTELGNVPFNETTIASIILSHLPVVWRTQYALTRVLVPESPRAILVDLENIKKLFAKKEKQSRPRQQGQGCSDCQIGRRASTQEGKANAWGRAREGDPQEGPYRQVLRMVQGC